eukprot:CAMPEP_0117690878 /NCGR_PEP_ID=MMETSP0804-20121206/25387_1 /TAXON_ID=1074897 /ORGANISM="Tetraselmis astigmatica, Strain CCMP880" /LENGTH=245 /DNA_ID=CAMNT_0005504005 /DNA_START=47 /DNA_END=783 /DNA_ORIENTATION=-
MALVRPEQVPEDRNPAPWVRYYMMQVKASKKIKEAKQAAAEPCPISHPPMMQAASQAGMPAAATALPSFRGRASQFILPPAPSCDRLAKGRKILEDLLEEIIFEMDQAKTHGDDEEVLGGYRALQGDLKSLLGGFWDQSAYDSRGRLQAAMFSSRSFAVGAAPPPAYMMQAADRAVEYVQGVSIAGWEASAGAPAMDQGARCNQTPWSLKTSGSLDGRNPSITAAAGVPHELQYYNRQWVALLAV